ncbi:C3HC zinc finger-like-domain-containing protein [Suillus bovinus]|uniref:C3HC zinc finger-like-domain-containing protein n=1 Tax=Suillus bovinus TaxID=48563 RepID=UPI001B8801C2|nr:C3HC zinc finger-like-domain-containing protein [Suillus bovinus]KAG2157936.1 C3HC zinc finger-like-domain-containing protein [Suillus bovinus]
MSTTEVVNSVNGLDSSSTSSLISIRATKRKFDDALQSLDSAVAPEKPLPERPTASKRPHMTRSLYSTLAKYGIHSNIPKPSIDTPDKHDILKSAPHLAAILARSKSKGATPFAHPSLPAASLSSQYRPSSTQSFLFRLSTYKLATYANKPPQIDAVAAAKCGWVNDGKDRLVCGICDVSWVVVGRDGMTREAANALVEKQRIQLVEMHKDGCPWHTRQCDSSIYRVPLQAPTVMARDIKSNALSLDPLLTDVVIKHPLSASQLALLRSAIASVKPPQAQSESDNESAMQVDADPEPSDTAIVIALFGWSLAPPAPPSERNRTSSLSRISTMSRPASPSLSRSSSVSRTARWERAESPSPSFSSPLTGISQLGGTPVRMRTPRMSDIGKSARDASLLHCHLCQRRVGLWAFTPSLLPGGSPLSHSSTKKREFDVLNEHRSYCPFVVPSTVVPKLPMPSTSPVSANTAADGTTDGWRAVLTVVLRHGLSERQRNARLSLSGGDNEIVHGVDDELEGVEAMVAKVKNQGVSLCAQLDNLERKLIAYFAATRGIEIRQRTVGLTCLPAFHHLVRTKCTSISNVDI